MKLKYPAYGNECRVCHKLNHFAAQCRSGNRKAPVNKVDEREDSTSDGSDYDEIKTVKTEIKQSAKQSTVSHFPKKLYTAMNVGNQPVNFQLDSGATCNVISLATLFGESQEECLKGN